MNYNLHTAKCEGVNGHYDELFFFFFFFFLGLHLQHMEVPRQGVESELHLPATATATATAAPDLSHICDLHCSPWQCQILIPLSKARDETCNVMDAGQLLTR